jgi:hypothetical protein
MTAVDGYGLGSTGYQPVVRGSLPGTGCGMGFQPMIIGRDADATIT